MFIKYIIIRNISINHYSQRTGPVIANFLWIYNYRSFIEAFFSRELRLRPTVTLDDVFGRAETNLG